MFCTNCGIELRDDIVFCTKCGQKVTGNSDNQAALQSNDAINPAEPSQSIVFAQEVVAERESSSLVENVPYESTLLNEPPVQEAQNLQDIRVSDKYAGQVNPRSSGLSVAAVISIVIAAVAVVSAIVIIFFVIKPFGSAGTTTVTAVQGQTPSSSSAAFGNDAESKPGDKEAESSSSSASSNSSKSSEAADDSPLDDPDGYILPDSKTHIYKKSELKNLSDYELYLARNEIYARHGRGFKNKDLQRYFNSKDWYHKKYSPGEFPESLLNSTERKNAITIQNVEKSHDSPYLN